ncbi:hypothetical protein FJTKL_00937 [Diaporthe vaccinii]|uniref:Uncharacterized protein n=1 Tax=Diaporthe vaccinii TaxID=105482 RepID=A0ABR4E1N2_9PEZI
MLCRVRDASSLVPFPPFLCAVAPSFDYMFFPWNFLCTRHIVYPKDRSCPWPPIGDSQYIYGLDSETHVRSSHSRTLREKEKETSWEGMSLFAALVRRHEASGPVVSSGPAQVRLYLLKPDRHSVKVLVRPKFP